MNRVRYEWPLILSVSPCLFLVVGEQVKVTALIYEIIVAEINAIKYFKAVNATLFRPTSDVH